jgi:hypothetical protein
MTYAYVNYKNNSRELGQRDSECFDGGICGAIPDFERNDCAADGISSDEKRGQQTGGTDSMACFTMRMVVSR